MSLLPEKGYRVDLKCPLREILRREGEDWKGGGGQITSKGVGLLRSNLPLGDSLLRGAGYFVTGHYICDLFKSSWHVSAILLHETL